MIILIDCE
jgi:molecular chaperone DnaK (HSP70)